MIELNGFRLDFSASTFTAHLQSLRCRPTPMASMERRPRTVPLAVQPLDPLPLLLLPCLRPAQA